LDKTKALDCELLMDTEKISLHEAIWYGRGLGDRELQEKTVNRIRKTRLRKKEIKKRHLPKNHK